MVKIIIKIVILEHNEILNNRERITLIKFIIKLILVRDFNLILIF